MSKSISRLMKYSVLQVLNGVATAGLNFVVILAYARWLGPRGFGRFVASQSQVLAWSWLVDLGLTTGLIGALHRAQCAPSALFKQVLKLRVLAASVATVGIALLSWFSFRDRADFWQDLAFTPYLFSFGIQYTVSAYLLFRDRLPTTVFANLLGVVAANAVAVTLAARGASVGLLLLGQSWGGFLAAAVMLATLRKDSRTSELSTGPAAPSAWQVLQSLWIDVRPTAVTMACVTLASRLDQIAAVRWLGFEAGGQYGLAVRFVAVPVLLFSSIQLALFSDMQRVGRDAPEKIQVYAGALSKFLVRFGLPFSIVFLLAMRVVVPWLLPKYQTAAWLLPAFTPAIWAYALYSVLSGALMGARKYSAVVWAHLWSLGIFLLALVLFTRPLGLPGLIAAADLFPVMLAALSYVKLKKTGVLQPGHRVWLRYSPEESRLLGTIRGKIFSRKAAL